MSLAVWPALLPFQSIKQGLKFTPPKKLSRTDFAAGNSRVRVTQPDANSIIPHRWVWSAAEFRLFSSWWVRGIDSGAAWFQVPVWNRETAYELATARFVGEYGDPDLQGVTYTVPGKLELDDLGNWAVLTVAQINARWPGTIEV